MSATGLDVFDKTIQSTNIWLDEIMDRLGPDRQLAWKVLSAVLHKLRDRLPTGLSAHLAAQLPLLVRGVYYDQYEPSVQPVRPASGEDFIHEVGKWLSDARAVDPKDAIAAVFAVLTHHLDPGMIEKARHALPEGLRVLWRVPIEAEAE
jgi:uncharacterized protein (DUF2267 family)